MNETERQIASMLRARMDRIKPLIREGNAFDYRYDEAEMILAAIERGEHKERPDGR